jgi:CRP-like cAMP-binding protein
LPAILLWQFSCEAGIYAEQLSNLCRRSAVERVAHFLLELLTRLQAVGLAEERSFTMPQTQALMGDLLGLSVSHVSRSLRQLRDDRLVSIEGPSVIIEDFEGLGVMADFERSHVSRLRINDALGRLGGS